MDTIAFDPRLEAEYRDYVMSNSIGGILIPAKDNQWVSSFNDNLFYLRALHATRPDEFLRITEDLLCEFTVKTYPFWDDGISTVLSWISEDERTQLIERVYARRDESFQKKHPSGNVLTIFQSMVALVSKLSTSSATLEKRVAEDVQKTIEGKKNPWTILRPILDIKNPELWLSTLKKWHDQKWIKQGTFTALSEHVWLILASGKTDEDIDDSFPLREKYNFEAACTVLKNGGITVDFDKLIPMFFKKCKGSTFLRDMLSFSVRNIRETDPLRKAWGHGMLKALIDIVNSPEAVSRSLLSVKENSADTIGMFDSVLQYCFNGRDNCPIGDEHLFAPILAARIRDDTATKERDAKSAYLFPKKTPHELLGIVAEKALFVLDSSQEPCVVNEVLRTLAHLKHGDQDALLDQEDFREFIERVLNSSSMPMNSARIIPHILTFTFGHQEAGRQFAEFVKNIRQPLYKNEIIEYAHDRMDKRTWEYFCKEFSVNHLRSLLAFARILNWRHRGTGVELKSDVITSAGMVSVISRAERALLDAMAVVENAKVCSVEQKWADAMQKHGLLEKTAFEVLVSDVLEGKIQESYTVANMVGVEPLSVEHLHILEGMLSAPSVSHPEADRLAVMDGLHSDEVHFCHG